MLTGKLFKTALAAAAVLALAAPAHASLVARYLDATTGVDAYFDTATSLTWLRDVRHADGTFNLINPSGLGWIAANAWATGLGTGWRLPSTVAGTGYQTNGEMFTLSAEGNLTSIYFQGLVMDPAMRPFYWSSTEVPGWAAGSVHYFFGPNPPLNNGSDDSILAYSDGYAMAVRNGDFGRSTEEVAPPGNSVPEPESFLLALTALGALALARRQRHGRGF